MECSSVHACVQAAEEPESTLVNRKTAVLRHVSVLLRDLTFMEVVAILDSKKLVFNLILDSMKPFLASYFLVRCPA
jgi:hypothetical protein